MLVSANTRALFGHYLALFALAALAGCDSSPPQANNPLAAAASTQAPPAAAPSAAAQGEKPLSDVDAQAFAKSLEATFKSGDRAAIDAAFDYDALLDRTMRGIDDQIRQKLIEDANSSAHGPRSIGRGLAAQIAKGARYRLLHVRGVGKEQRALFRRTTHGGMDYVDYVLIRSADGKVRIADFYDFLQGCLVSDAFHQEALGAAVRVKPGFIHKLSPAEHEYFAFDDSGSIPKMRQLAAAGQVKEALEVYKTFPDVLKDHPQIVHEYLVARCSSAADCDDAIRDYRAKCPNDPGVDLILMNHYVLGRRADDALACIDRLDNAVGGDPYLDADRASAYVLKGDLAAAKKCAQKAAAAEPDEARAQEFLKLVAKMETSLPAGQPEAGLDLSKPSAGQPAGDDEAKAFAEAFVKSMMANDTAALRASIDLGALYQRSMAGINVPEATRVGIESGYQKYAAVAFADIFSPFSRLLAQGKGGFRLLRLHRVKSEQHALFRVIGSSGAVSYFDCTLVRHADGKVLIVDVYIHAMGTSLAEMMRHGLSLAYPKAGKSPSDAGAGPPNAGVELGTAWTDMQKQDKTGHYQAALDIYEKLSPDLQKEKLLLYARLNAAKHLKGKPYDAAVRAYRQHYPDDVSTNLILIDAYADHKLYDRELASIDAVDRAVGGDPYLDMLRSRAFRMKGDLAAEKECVNKAIVAEPDLKRHVLQ